MELGSSDRRFVQLPSVASVACTSQGPIDSDGTCGSTANPEKQNEAFEFGHGVPPMSRRKTSMKFYEHVHEGVGFRTPRAGLCPSTWRKLLVSQGLAASLLSSFRSASLM